MTRGGSAGIVIVQPGPARRCQDRLLNSQDARANDAGIQGVRHVLDVEMAGRKRKRALVHALPDRR